ncbi:MAG: hypothetical protein ACYTFW_13315 [Planctomycetota bacterium]|jgi:hypothetical protein
MKSQDVYSAWKEKRNQIDVQEHFTDEVMKQICQYEQKKRKPLFDYQRFVEFISAHLSAQAALIVVGAVTGFIRLVFVILVILNKGDING